MRTANDLRVTALAAILVALATLATVAAPARADIYRFDASIYEAGASGPDRYVSVELAGLDPTKSTNLRVRRPGMDAPAGVVDFPAGRSDLYTNELTELRPGDSIEVRQPLNGVDPVETLSLPAGSIEFDGSRVSGTAGTGEARWLETLATCVEQRERRLIASPGGFSFDLGGAATPGRLYSLAVREKPGFSMRYLKRAPGERPCAIVRAATGSLRPPGSVVPEARTISVDDLDPSVPTTRLVILRGSASMLDRNLNSPGYLSVETDVKVLPGDRIELYRPQTAPSPSTTIEVPPVTATFDPANDLAAVRGAPMAEVEITACRPRACEPFQRNLLSAPAGIGRVDFGLPQGILPRFDLQAGDLVRADVRFARVPLRYTFDAVSGDLAPPSLRIRVRGRVRLIALRRLLGKGLPVRVASSEPATGQVRLRIGGAILAKTAVSVVGNPTDVLARFTPKGKRVVRRWLALGTRKPRNLTVESRLADRSGNAVESVLRLKVVP